MRRCEPRSLADLALVDLAALHDELHPLELGDVLQRIAIDGDDVGVFPGSMAPESPPAWSNSAATTVADRIACIGVIPYRTM
jgi:hypothetical protein